MKRVPETTNAVVLRTDFSDDAEWTSLCAAIQAPVGMFRAYVDCISDPDYDGLTPEQLPALTAAASGHGFIFLVDGTTIAHPEHPVLVMDLRHGPGRTFRVVPSEMWGVENNL